MLDGKHVILVIEVEDIMGATAENVRTEFVKAVWHSDGDALRLLRSWIVDGEVSAFEDIGPPIRR